MNIFKNSRNSSIQPVSFFTAPLLLSSAGMFLDGYSLTVIAFAIILINPYFRLNTLESGLIIASVVFGSIIGALLIGYFSDVFGRKSVYILNMAVFVISGIISAFSVKKLTGLIEGFVEFLKVFIQGYYIKLPDLK